MGSCGYSWVVWDLRLSIFSLFDNEEVVSVKGHFVFWSLANPGEDSSSNSSSSSSSSVTQTVEGGGGDRSLRWGGRCCCFIASQSARSVSDSEEGVSGMLKKGTWLPVGQEVEEPVDEIVGADSRRRSAFASLYRSFSVSSSSSSPASPWRIFLGSPELPRTVWESFSSSVGRGSFLWAANLNPPFRTDPSSSGPGTVSTVDAIGSKWTERLLWDPIISGTGRGPQTPPPPPPLNIFFKLELFANITIVFSNFRKNLWPNPSFRSAVLVFNYLFDR